MFQVDAKTGLSDSEAARRLNDIGPNEFKAEPPDPLWLKYVKQFMEPMIGLLIASALVSIVMGQFDDAVSISTVGSPILYIFRSGNSYCCYSWVYSRT